jgi:hypothetical protein
MGTAVGDGVAEAVSARLHWVLMLDKIHAP